MLMVETDTNYVYVMYISIHLEIVWEMFFLFSVVNSIHLLCTWRERVRAGTQNFSVRICPMCLYFFPLHIFGPTCYLFHVFVFCEESRLLWCLFLVFVSSLSLWEFGVHCSCVRFSFFFIVSQPFCFFFIPKICFLKNKKLQSLVHVVLWISLMQPS